MVKSTCSASTQRKRRSDSFQDFLIWRTSKSALCATASESSEKQCLLHFLLSQRTLLDRGRPSSGTLIQKIYIALKRGQNLTFGFGATASESSEKQWLLVLSVKEHCMTEDGHTVAREFRRCTSIETLLVLIAMYRDDIDVTRSVVSIRANCGIVGNVPWVHGAGTPIKPLVAALDKK